VCFEESISSLIVGLVLGILIQKLSAALMEMSPFGSKRIKPGSDPHNRQKKTSIYDADENNLGKSDLKAFQKEITSIYTSDGKDRGDSNFTVSQNKFKWRNERKASKCSRCDSSFTKSNLSRRATLFANSIRKLSTISGRRHGLIEARGKVTMKTATFRKFFIGL
jgi:hypothetical protein